jgi:hypothetical protein
MKKSVAPITSQWALRKSFQVVLRSRSGAGCNPVCFRISAARPQSRQDRCADKKSLKKQILLSILYTDSVVSPINWTELQHIAAESEERELQIEIEATVPQRFFQVIIAPSN